MAVEYIYIYMYIPFSYIANHPTWDVQSFGGKRHLFQGIVFGFAPLFGPMVPGTTPQSEHED